MMGKVCLFMRCSAKIVVDMSSEYEGLHISSQSRIGIVHTLIKMASLPSKHTKRFKVHGGCLHLFNGNPQTLNVVSEILKLDWEASEAVSSPERKVSLFNSFFMLKTVC